MLCNFVNPFIFQKSEYRNMSSDLTNKKLESSNGNQRNESLLSSAHNVSFTLSCIL